MSLNTAMSRSFVVDVEALTNRLASYVQRWKFAITVEQRAAVEAEAISAIEQLLDFEFTFRDLLAGAPLLAQELGEFYTAYKAMLESNIAKTQALSELFTQYFNTQQIALHHLFGKLRRVRQKRAALGLWSVTDAKYLLADHFINLDYVDAAFTSVTPANVDTTQGILTLPISGTEQVPIARISIGEGSNGRPGNSDVAVTGNNARPGFAVDGDPNNWFEYERLDSGPLLLSLHLELDRPEIINQLSMQSVNFGSSQAFSVEDILFSTNGNDTRSILDLAGPSVDSDRFVVKAVGNDTSWHVNFLPIRTRTITLKLRQNSSYLIQVANANRTSAARARWAIGLKSVRTSRIAYQQTGGINSIVHLIPAGLYAGVPFLQIWPTDSTLFDVDLETSIDAGEHWTTPENVDDGPGGTVLLDGTGAQLVWRLTAKRNDDALANATSFVPEDGETPVTESMLRLVSPNISPAILRLTSKPATENVYVFQPRVARRGDRFRRLKLGKTKGGIQSIQLPFALPEFGLDPADMVLGVEGVPYDYVSNPTALAAGEWSFSRDYTSVVFNTDTSVGADVDLVFAEEMMLFEERPNGFLHRMELPFDGDKSNIKITALPKAGARNTLILPRDKKIIKLPHKNIIESSLQLFSDQSVAYTSVSNRWSLIAGTYYFDDVNGVIEVFEEFGSDQVRASYTYFPTKLLESSDYEVVFEGPKPVGVLVSGRAFEATAVTEVLSDPLLDRYDLRTGVYGSRDFVITGTFKARSLSYDRVVRGSLKVSNILTGLVPEEVPFMDGHSEFLGLVQIKDEQTVETLAGTNIVTFNLSAGALWNSTILPAFSDTVVFADPKGTLGAVVAIGDYHISVAGVVSVYVGTGNTLPGGITIQYFYKNPAFIPSNKYSCDYANGVLYSYTNMNASGTVSYKTATYKAEYDIGLVLPSTYNRADNSVSVDTENMSKINRNVKICWPVRTDSQTLRELTPYFTPIIELLALRFN